MTEENIITNPEGLVEMVMSEKGKGNLRMVIFRLGKGTDIFLKDFDVIKVDFMAGGGYCLFKVFENKTDEKRDYHDYIGNSLAILGKSTVQIDVLLVNPVGRYSKYVFYPGDSLRCNRE